VVRFRALGLLVAVLALAASALWIGSANGDAVVLHHRIGPAFADLEQAVVVSTAGEAKTPSRWVMPLAALGAAVAVAFRYFGRRDLHLVRASFPVRRRLVHACRRAPPVDGVLHMF
jgi:hypothetical protein